MERTRTVFNFHTSGATGAAAEKGIVDATIAFLNGATIRVDGAEHEVPNDFEDWLEGSQLMRAGLLERLGKAGMLIDEGAIDPQDYESRYRTQLKGMFSAYVLDRIVTLRQFVAERYTLPLPGLSALCPTEDGMSIVHDYDLRTYVHVVRIGEALLLDPEKKIGQKLCQCRLPSCRRFFFEIKPPAGRAQRRYCCKAHMDELHKDNAANRMKKSRENKRRRNAEKHSTRKRATPAGKK